MNTFTNISYVVHTCGRSKHKSTNYVEQKDIDLLIRAKLKLHVYPRVNPGTNLVPHELTFMAVYEPYTSVGYWSTSPSLTSDSECAKIIEYKERIIYMSGEQYQMMIDEEESQYTPPEYISDDDDDDDDKKEQIVEQEKTKYICAIDEKYKDHLDPCIQTKSFIKRRNLLVYHD